MPEPFANQNERTFVSMDLFLQKESASQGMTDAEIEETSRDVFSQALEKKCQEQGISHIEGLAELIQECDADPMILKKLISNNLKEKIYQEAVSKRLIRGEVIGPTIEDFF